ncbi:hypothetical protein LCGC14_0639910 [marine sediment metagenome]|uniref:Uncharacterized protein n=1 Tax=marine sediment metagenome TaxID=412755 RepID=A0A0F9TKY0_9ZZZZ
MKNLIVSRNPAKKRRSAAQKAASRRNIKKAQAVRRRGGRRRTTKKRRRRNPYPVAHRRRSNPRRRFPTVQGIINDQVIPAAVGGAGAVINDLVVNMLPLPANFKSGWMRHISKAVGAIAIGYLGGMFLAKKTADQLGAGAMTVVGYNVVRDLAAQFMPQLQLGEYLPMGEYLDPALGYYGAGLNPSTIPGSGLETDSQFTRGSPYMGDGLDTWPTGGAYDDIQ